MSTNPDPRDRPDYRLFDPGWPQRCRQILLTLDPFTRMEHVAWIRRQMRDRYIQVILSGGWEQDLENRCFRRGEETIDIRTFHALKPEIIDSLASRLLDVDDV